MRGKDAAGRFNSIAVSALAGALALAGGWLGAAPTAAAFPGGNGKIAFASDRVTAGNPEGDYEVFAMNPDGTGVRQLTANTAVDGSPAWSPDGTQLAFRSERDGNAEIYTMSAGGANQTRRTTDGEFDREPDWQPKPRR